MVALCELKRYGQGTLTFLHLFAPLEQEFEQDTEQWWYKEMYHTNQ